MTRVTSSVPPAMCALLYHHVGRPVESMYAGLNISSETFSRQMAWLASHGFRGVSARDWMANRQRSGGAPRPILLTFDDAYAETAQNAFPILERLGFSATVFVVTAHIGGTNDWDQAKGFPAQSLMSAAQIRDWNARGIEIGAHSRTHPDLRGLPPPSLEDEIAGSKRDLDTLLQTPVTSFAYPYGHFDDAALAVVCRYFALAFTTADGLNGDEVPRHQLRRAEIAGDETLRQFAIHVRLGYRPWKRLRARVRAAMRRG